VVKIFYIHVVWVINLKNINKFNTKSTRHSLVVVVEVELQPKWGLLLMVEMKARRQKVVKVLVVVVVR